MTNEELQELLKSDLSKGLTFDKPHMENAYRNNEPYRVKVNSFVIMAVNLQIGPRLREANIIQLSREGVFIKKINGIEQLFRVNYTEE